MPAQSFQRWTGFDTHLPKKRHSAPWLSRLMVFGAPRR